MRGNSKGKNMKRQRRSFANILTTALAAALSTILTVGAMCGCTADQGKILFLTVPEPMMDR